MSSIKLYILAIEIGEAIQHEIERTAEENKQKVIRCTEEIVRREEGERREKELVKAREEWKKEKQKFIKEAHHNLLRAISKETDILEKELRKEFEEDIAQVRTECRSHLEATVQAVWQDADKMREQALTDARLEEQHIAQEEAYRVVERVSEEKRQEKEESEKDKSMALADLTKQMNKICQDAFTEKERKMNEKFAVRTREIQQKHESLVSSLEEQLEDELANNSTLKTKLQEITDTRDCWKRKYENLELEFSDFIDQIPGFRGEFILKEV